jgi:hypothetical protein
MVFGYTETLLGNVTIPRETSSIIAAFRGAG